MDYSGKTYEELSLNYTRLKTQYNDLADKCAKEGLSYDEFCDKAHDIKEQMYFIDKYIRLKQIPTVDFGKEWQGDTFTIEYFKHACNKSLFIDSDGFGYYATETGKSDIEIYPSDVKENLLRDDFTHVIWFSELPTN